VTPICQCGMMHFLAVLCSKFKTRNGNNDNFNGIE
jgi:hypothetical protein